MNRQGFRFRLSLALFGSFLLIGAFAIMLFVYSSRAYQQEITQLMHKELATHVVEEYRFYQGDKPDIESTKETFHNLMYLGANFEFYLLDTSGKILAYSTDPAKIKREKVSLAPIQTYLNTSILDQPIHGQDPRSLTGEKIFSVATIKQNDQVQGYLYVILGSEIYDEIADMVLSSQILQWGLGLLTAGFAFALLSALWITGLITKPLHLLTSQVKTVQQTGLSKQSVQNIQVIERLEQWQEGTQDEVNILGSAFRELLEQLNEQYQNVVTVDELRKELLSHVSHDLRTPLASLLGYLETWELNEGKVSDIESRQYIHIAKKNAHKISLLIEQLFELAYLDSGNVQVNKEHFSIAELIQDVLQKFQIEAQQKQIHLDISPKDSSICVCGDIEKLERVFTNLIENAIRHTPEGGSITVKLINSSGLVSVEVTDTGIGIPEADIPHVFDPHYKAQNSVRENTAHGGLGLAITKKILDLHQSEIAVKSAIGQGTTFEFSLAAKA